MEKLESLQDSIDEHQVQENQISTKEQDQKLPTSDTLLESLGGNTVELEKSSLTVDEIAQKESDLSEMFYTIDDLAREGIVSGMLIHVPVNGVLVEKKVSITPQGFVILSTTDPRRVSDINEIYTQKNYYQIIQKIRSGIYLLPVAQVPDSGESVLQKELNQPHKKTLAELLTGTTSHFVDVSSEQIVGTAISDNTDKLISPTVLLSQTDSVISNITSKDVSVEASILISLDKLSQTEQLLVKEKKSLGVFNFIQSAFRDVLTLENIPMTTFTQVPQKIVSEVAPEVIVKPVTHTTIAPAAPPTIDYVQGAKIDPLSMFN